MVAKRMDFQVIRKFSLFGLYGYKNVSLACNSVVKIASADNGSGKTSLLNAMHAIFEGRPSVLYALDFNRIEIVWGDGSKSSYSKKELFGDIGGPELKEIAGDNFFSEWGVPESDALEILTKFIFGDREEAAQTKAFKTLYDISPWDRQEIFENLSGLTDGISETGDFSELHARAKKALENCSVLYLPTYRRIEADMPEYRDRGMPVPNSYPNRSRGRGQKDIWESAKLIYFGMTDIEVKLNSIITQIRKETLEAYSRSNGQTLEQLIGSQGSEDNSEKEIFDLASIEVVLARVGKNTTDLRARLAEIIESGEIHIEKRRELRRFLSQLLRVYAQRREDEEAIENFVNIVNKYLYPETGGDVDKYFRNEKKIFFDKLKLELAVKNVITQKELKFGSLSSGEKQVVSIFARLMLDPRRKYLILVDEPELSLSIEWQQRLLPDIFSTVNCVQLIAITHSPFIFDNDLAVYSGTIETSYLSEE